MSSKAIELSGLRHSYGQAEILRGIDLTIEHGEIFGSSGTTGRARPPPSTS